MPKNPEIVHLFFQIQKAIHEKMRDTNKTMPLSLSEVVVIKILHAEKNPTVSLLAAHLNVRKASISMLIKHLEQKAYLKKVQNKSDKRSQHLKLTPKGKKIIQSMTAFCQKHTKTLFDVLDAKEKQQLMVLLEKIIAQEKTISKGDA